MNLMCLVQVSIEEQMLLLLITSKFREFMSPAIIVYYLNEKK